MTSAADVQASMLDANRTFFASAREEQQHGPAVPDGVIFITVFLMDVCYAIPDDIVFNGDANQYKDAPLTAKAGRLIRLSVVNAGPSEVSAFHVIGAIFSDVYVDGNPANHTVGDQTVMIPPGGAVMIQRTIPQPGLYPFVTHSFVDVGKGALGMIKGTP